LHLDAFHIKMSSMRTTVDIPESLLRRARARAALDGIKMMDVVNEALARYLGDHEDSNANTSNLPRGVKSESVGQFSFPVVQSRKRGGAKSTAGDLKQLDSVEDEERHAKVFGC